MADTSVLASATSLTRWRNAIIAAFGLGGISVSAWGPRLPAVTAGLGVNTGTIGLLLGVAVVSGKNRADMGEVALGGFLSSVGQRKRAGTLGGLVESTLDWPRKARPSTLPNRFGVSGGGRG